MSYAVKEIFLTLQGEGAHAGRAAVFCRFAGCNLWSGREEDRAKAVCRFCDTDFVGTDGTLGGRFASADELADTIAAQWTGDDANRYVVLTGGEPLLQVDQALIDALHARGLRWGVVTNKMARFTDPLTRAMPLFASASTVISGDTTPHPKPHPAPLLEAVRRLQSDPARCIYVGDDERDALSGRAAGMTTIVAAWGYLGDGLPIGQWGADAVIATPLELLALL